MEIRRNNIQAPLNMVFRIWSRSQLTTECTGLQFHAKNCRIQNMYSIRTGDVKIEIVEVLIDCSPSMDFGVGIHSMLQF